MILIFKEIIFLGYFRNTFESIKGIYSYLLNPFKPGFTIVIFIHYKPRIAIAILAL